MKISSILTCISCILFPFMVLFGLYIIINGDISPGGGFQGGVILATAYMITYFINPEKNVNLHMVVAFEKYLFLLIIALGFLSFFTKGEWFTNFISTTFVLGRKRIFLIALNFLIGIKVALGLISIFEAFTEEGK